MGIVNFILYMHFLSRIANLADVPTLVSSKEKVSSGGWYLSTYTHPTKHLILILDFEEVDRTKLGHSNNKTSRFWDSTWCALLWKQRCWLTRPINSTLDCATSSEGQSRHGHSGPRNQESAELKWIKVQHIPLTTNCTMLSPFQPPIGFPGDQKSG